MVEKDLAIAITNCCNKCCEFCYTDAKFTLESLEMDYIEFEELTTEEWQKSQDELKAIETKRDELEDRFRKQNSEKDNLKQAIAECQVKLIRAQELIERLKLLQPPGGTARGLAEARAVADRIGYPVLVRPSYVLGGRAMEICHEPSKLEGFLQQALEASPDAPVLIDKFIEDAIEVDADAVADGRDVIVAGLLEHIEEAGTHSGDAAMAFPPHSLSDRQIGQITDITAALARALNVCGLMNVQYAVKGSLVYVLEVNPRASRTVPFISKATGVPWAKIATRCMVGVSLKEQGVKPVAIDHICIKESVFPFNKFLGNDTVLGPEMKSTGEVMGIDMDFGRAFAKSEIAAYQRLPSTGRVFISVCDQDKRAAVSIAKRLVQMGFEIVSTSGTHKILSRHGIPAMLLKKISEGRPNVLDLMRNGELVLAINTPSGKGHHTDEARIRTALVARNIPLITTIAGAEAAVTGIESMREGYSVKPLQDYYKALRNA